MSLLKGKHASLVRRELWEHRALWTAPLLVAVVTLILPLIGFTRFNTGDGPQGGNGASTGRTPTPELFGDVTMIIVVLALGGVLCIALFAYLLDCLYAERKDRSILFWKSLPVSDAETVLAKLGVALLLMPLLVLLLAAVVQPLLLAVLQLRYDLLDNAISIHSVLGGYKTLAKLVPVWLFGILWYSPFIAYLLLASVLAKRVPLMYAMVPPGVLVLLEGLLLGSWEVARFIGSRMAPWTRSDWAWDFQQQRGGAPVAIGSPDWSVLYSNASLWLGLAAAAGMVYIVIRLRRYRDDT